MNISPKYVVFVLCLLVTAVVGLPCAAGAAEELALTMTASPSLLVFDASTTLSVQGAPAGATLTLSRKRADEAEFTVVETAVADANGAASWTRTPPRSTTYRVDVAADESWPAASAEVLVGVRPRVTLQARARTPLFEDGKVRYTVTVRPAHPGGTVQLRRRTRDGWASLGVLTLGADSRGSISLSSSKPGKLIVRAFMVADADHLVGRSGRYDVTVYDRRNPYGVPTKYPHLILVDLSQYKLYYHEHGNVIRVFDCVLGRPSLPTPRGHFKIYAKDPHMGGPYGPFRMRYLGLYAIHGTNEPWLLTKYPRNFSHGCTRLSNANITWLYARVHVGTPVWNVP